MEWSGLMSKPILHLVAHGLVMMLPAIANSSQILSTGSNPKEKRLESMQQLICGSLSLVPRMLALESHLNNFGMLIMMDPLHSQISVALEDGVNQQSNNSKAILPFVELEWTKTSIHDDNNDNLNCIQLLSW